MSPSPDPALSPAAFGASLRAFLDAAVAGAPPRESPLLVRVREHLGTEPAELPIVRRDLAPQDHPNLQLALDALFAEPGRSATLIGLRGDHYHGMGLRELLVPQGGDLLGGPGPDVGPVEYENVELEPGRTINCVGNGLFLVGDADGPLALVLRRQQDMGPPSLRLEGVAARREDAERFLERVREEMRLRNVYRGQVVAFLQRRYDEDVSIRIERLPAVERDEVVLPAGTLERVERAALAPSRHHERLLAAGRHLKRGLLLHGPPGTGKTLTARHLIGRMPGRTVIILTGQSFGFIEAACTMARDLQPATVILEDVDLVGEERTHPGAVTPLLFELLNQMDGLAGDADVLFLLTTNRPELLEPALAARPGRVDQLIEVPLPDAEGRRRLIELYGRGLEVRPEGIETTIEGTEGASGAVIRELLRKAAVLAAEEGEGALVVEERHLRSALDELRVGAEALVPKLRNGRDDPDLDHGGWFGLD